MNRTELTESARTLLRGTGQGVLSTFSVKVPGYPFGSLLPYALDPQGQPVFLVSSLAVHTKNLLADPRASLTVVEQTDAPAAAAGRLTLVGDAVRVTESEEVSLLYLERHPEASQWLGFGDFSFWRLETKAIYYVAGFGAMGWIELDPSALD